MLGPSKKIAALFCFGMAAANAGAQSPIVGYSTTYISTSSTVNSYSQKPAANSNSFRGCSGNNFTYGFNKGTDNALKLLNFIANAKSYFIANTTAARVVLRRVDNANVTGNRTVVSMEAAASSSSACPSGGKLDLRLPYQDAMENFLNNNFINQGTDNIFTNSGNGDGNVNNIERVDILFPSGLASSNATDAGFAIFDRGNSQGHDGFRIAAITSLNANGDPASFGAVKTSVKGNGTNNGSWGHPSIANGNRSLSTYVLRKEGNETRLRASAAIDEQEIGGVFFSFADLGIAAGQKIYGYAVFSTDGIANPTSAQLLNINDASVYPTNTTETYGGLDMMAVNAVFSTGGTPLSSSKSLLKATAGNHTAILNWELSGLSQGSSAELERSENGRDYSSVYRIPVQDLAARGSFTEALAKTCFFRVRIQPLTGAVYFSNVVKVEGRPQKLSVYPNQLKGPASIIVEGLEDGLYNASFASGEGRVYATSLRMVAGKGRMDAPVPVLFKGMIWLNFTDSRGRLYPGGKLVFQ